VSRNERRALLSAAASEVTSDTPVASGATALLDGSVAFHNVTISGNATLDFVWSSTTDESTLVRVIQGGSGGFTPTFAGVTWVGEQPTWSTMSGGFFEEIRVYTVEGLAYAEFHSIANALDHETRLALMDLSDQSFILNRWTTPPYTALGTVSFSANQAAFFRWYLKKAITIDAWAYEVTTGFTAGASATNSVRAGFCTLENGQPTTLIGNFDADVIAGGAVIATGVRSLGPGGSGAGFTAANETEITIGPGTVYGFFGINTGGTGTTLTTAAFRATQQPVFVSSATVGDMFGASQTTYAVASTTFTGAMPTTPTISIVNKNIPRVCFRVKAIAS
jgi:hypothetical protein